MQMRKITRSLFVPVALILLCFGCETDASKDRKHHEETLRAAEEWRGRIQRSTYMIQVAIAAHDQLHTIKDKDPKVAARHRTFLKCVDDTGMGYAKQLEDHDPFSISPLIPKKDLKETDLKYVLDRGFEEAKFGAGDEALAKSFKDSLMAMVQVGEEKDKREAEEKESRKKARESYK